VEILHLARADDWVAAQGSGAYRTSTRGKTLEEVGYIHSSTSDQLTKVAEAFYAGETSPLVVLVMDDDEIRSTGIEVRLEDGGDGELYPHIYGPIEPSVVKDVRPAGFDAAGRFFVGPAGIA
jgi:uncharacterized protein (DUF952 family)